MDTPYQEASPQILPLFIHNENPEFDYIKRFLSFPPIRLPADIRIPMWMDFAQLVILKRFPVKITRINHLDLIKIAFQRQLYQSTKISRKKQDPTDLQVFLEGPRLIDNNTMQSWNQRFCKLKIIEILNFQENSNFGPQCKENSQSQDIKNLSWSSSITMLNFK